MDITAIGIDTAIIGGIIALANVIKSFDTENRFKRFYPLIPLGLGILAAYFKIDPFAFKPFGSLAITYVGISSYLFKFGKTTLLNQ